MKKLSLAFGVLSLFAVNAMADSWEGVISDAKCGKAHAEKLNEKCVQSCVKGGQAAVFVTSEGKVLKIHNPEAVAEHLGHKVTLTGKLMDGAVHVDSVKM
jgi:hypothetical protein